MEYNDYYLGLDIGTNSIGWAVTNTDYTIPKFKGNAMWGIRLFDECNTAEERRGFRSGRRRTQRCKERIALLEMLFDKEISKVDNSFFQRLHESNLYLDDKSENVPYAVFADEKYTDRDYHKDFPTVYHLRKELVHNNGSHDIRLVYLALHHIIKHRGHFLFDFDSDAIEAINDFNLAFDELLTYINQNYCCEDDDKELYLNDEDEIALSDILKDKATGKTKKNSEIAKLFGITKKNDRQLYSMLTLLSGSSVALADIFDDEALKKVENNKVSFSGNFDDKALDYQSYLGERFELLEKLQAVYNWAVLADILDGKNYLCEAKVEIYEKHKSDLKLLKEYVKTYLPEKYNAVFKVSGKDKNYVAYSKHFKTNGKSGTVESTATQEDFCKYLKNTLGKCADENFANMFFEIENGTFMPKQVSKDNSVIPMQINEKELKAILNNAKEYLPFLNSVDENGIGVCEKIIKIFEYRIPYYIGPLNTHSDKAWLKRTEGKIYPWNINEIVDFDKSAEAFINNLTSKCTYLPQFDVIPKNSLLYSKFTVLNELNNLKIDGKKISVELKQNIYNDLFMTHQRVSKKALEKYLNSIKIDYTTLSGFDGNFKSSLKPFADFSNYDLAYEEKDEIIKAITIFGDDKKLLRKRLRNKFSTKLSDDEIIKISRLKYTGWGRLSKEFLTSVTATYKESGEVMNIIDALWNTNFNLTELLYSNEFCCDSQGKLAIIDKIAELNTFDNEKSLIDIVNDLYISPKIKRPVYQSLLIAKEIEKITKHPAKKIFIEVTRGAQEKKRTQSRKSRLLDLYKSCQNEYEDLYNSLSEKSDDELRSDKLYLYYTQFGKCMYTGERIDLEQLMSNNSKYDIDHIYPQSKIKDDSLDNRVLVNKVSNAKKDNEYPIPNDVRTKMGGFWNMLLSKGLIRQKKYDRLTRNTPLTDEELSEFISRQLVETNQSVKAVANVLEQLYPDTEIVYVKSALATEFRNKYDMLKSRDINDFHHAKDAYLNIVAGNVYNVKFTHNKINFIKELQRNNKEYTVKLTSVLKHNIDGAWVTENNESLNIVKNTMNKNNIRYTRYAFKKQGGFWDQNILKKGKGQAPIKVNSKRADIAKYGGFNNVWSAYFSLVKYKDKKNKETVQLVPIDAYREKEYQNNKEAYVSDIIGCPVEIIIPCIKYNACLSINGFRIHISGKSNGGSNIICKPAVQLVLGYKFEKYVKGIEKCQTKGYKSNTIKDYEISKENNLKLYNAIIDKLSTTLFKTKYSKLYNDLVKEKSKFEQLELNEQCATIEEIIKILHCNVVTGDLSKIGLGSKFGKMTSNCNFSTIKGINSVKLINQSITGLFENEVELLK